MFSGEAGMAIPIQPSACSMEGSHVPGSNSRVSGDCWPGLISTSTSRKVMTEAAMKLNMIVVMTMWLPRFA